MAISFPDAVSQAVLPPIVAHRITIEGAESNIHRQDLLYRLECDENNYASLATAKLLSKTETRDWSFLSASFMPVRTDTLRNFAVDLMFPTLIHHAMKVHNLFARFLSVIIAFVWDILTLPVRMLAVPFRLTYTHCIRDKSHTLVKFIPHGLDNAGVQKGFVKVVDIRQHIRNQQALNLAGNGAIARSIDTTKLIVETRREERLVSLIDQSSHTDCKKIRIDRRSQFYTYDPDSNSWIDTGMDNYRNTDNDHDLASEW